jgi:hypothetical protein
MQPTHGSHAMANSLVNSPPEALHHGTLQLDNVRRGTRFLLEVTGLDQQLVTSTVALSVLQPPIEEGVGWARRVTASLFTSACSTVSRRDAHANLG